MDQRLLDSSKYRISSLSIDTRFADQLYHGTSDFMIRTPSTYKNIARVMLSSVELPLTEFVFSDHHGNVTFAVQVGESEDWIVKAIPDGNYTPDQMLTIMTIRLREVDQYFNCEMDKLTGRFIIMNTNTPFKLKLFSDKLTIACRRTHWGIGYYLGFREKEVSSGPNPCDGTQQVVATALLQVNPTPYYLLQLSCSETLDNIVHRVSEGGSVPAFAKLVLRNGMYVLQFINGDDWMRKEYTFLTPVNISQIRVKLLDPFGEIVNMSDMDWSLTLELYEVVNSRTYAHMGLGYER
jgi:hypothetical protein